MSWAVGWSARVDSWHSAQRNMPSLSRSRVVLMEFLRVGGRELRRESAERRVEMSLDMSLVIWFLFIETRRYWSRERVGMISSVLESMMRMFEQSWVRLSRVDRICVCCLLSFKASRNNNTALLLWFAN